MSENKNFRDIIIETPVVGPNIYNKVYSVKILRYITRNKAEFAVVDCKLKSECICPVSELEEGHVVGTIIDVMMDKNISNMSDYILVSHRKAMYQQKKNQLQVHKLTNSTVMAKVVKRITNGYLLEIDGSIGVLRTQQEITDKEIEVLIKHIPDPLSNKKIICILRSKIEKCKVTQMNDFFVFVEILSTKSEGVIHIKDLSIKNIKHPMDVCKPGDIIEAAVIKISAKQTVLSVRRVFFIKMEEFIKTHKVGDIVEGLEVILVHKYGIDVKYSEYIHGFLPRSEASWGFVPEFTVGSKIKAKIIELNFSKRKIIFSLKQMQENPMEQFMEKYPIGTKITFKVTDKSDYRAFGELEGVTLRIKSNSFDQIEHTSLSLFSECKVGDSINCTVDSYDQNNKPIVNVTRIPDENQIRLEYDKIYKCTVHTIKYDGLLVRIEDTNRFGLIRPNHISKNLNVSMRSFKEGQEIDAEIISIGGGKKMPLLSIKQTEKRHSEKLITQNNLNIKTTFAEFL